MRVYSPELMQDLYPKGVNTVVQAWIGMVLLCDLFLPYTNMAARWWNSKIHQSGDIPIVYVHTQTCGPVLKIKQTLGFWEAPLKQE